MAAEPNLVVIDPEGETAALLEQAGDAPIIVELNGRRYRVSPEPDDPFANYDPDRAERAFARVFGILQGVDVEALKAELRAQRDQDSSGRPA